MLTAKPTDTVADLAARIREDRAKPLAPGQIVTPWLYTPEEAAERMIGAAQEKERLDRWAASVGMDLDGPEAMAEHARRVEAGTPPTERAVFKAQRARCIEAARACDDADEVEYSAAVDALSVELAKLDALDPGPWNYVVAPWCPEPVRHRHRGG